MDMRIKSCWADKEYPIALKRGQYTNGNLAIQMYCEDGYGWEPYAALTVNLDEKLPEDMAYVDVNNLPNAVQFIEHYGLGSFTGRWGLSGFCKYPLYKFDLSKI